MPRGIYDRTKAKKTAEITPKKAPTVKKTAAKKRIMRKPRSIGQAMFRASQDPGPMSLVVPPLSATLAPEPKEFFVIGDAKGLHIFDTVDECVRYMVDNGATADAIGGDTSTQILTMKSLDKPEPKNVRLTYAL